MGNKHSQQESDQLPVKYAFNEEEVQSIKKIYTELSTIENDNKTISSTALGSKLSENKDFAAKLYKWMIAKCPGGIVCPECFIAILEIFVKDPIDYCLALGLNKFERIELFALICIEKYDIAKESAPKLKISYADCFLIVKVAAQHFLVFNDLLNMFKIDGADDDNSGALAVTNELFQNKQDQLDFGSFISQLKEHMIYISKMIAYYFLSKFVGPSYSRFLTPPKLDTPSKVLTPQLFTLLWLNNPEFQNIGELNLIYSLATKGTSFSRLSTTVTEYGGPTLIVLMHKDEESKADSEGNDPSICIMGAYMSAVWTDTVDFQGDNKTFLFSLLPKYKEFHTSKGQGGQTYAYLNSREVPGSASKTGLGFGGAGFGNFRIWIDQDVGNKSYTQPNDITFEDGYLAPPDVTKLSIQEIEIWGLGGEEASQKQIKMEEFKAEQVEKSKKVNKKDLSQFDKEILLEKTFQAANNKEDR